jgi:hypothetical protein
MALAAALNSTLPLSKRDILSYTKLVTKVLLNKSKSSFLSHTASLLATMYYASSVLWAKEPCFLLDQEIIVEPKLKQYPEVLFRSTVLSIQSKSINP